MIVDPSGLCFAIILQQEAKNKKANLTLPWAIFTEVAKEKIDSQFASKNRNQQTLEEKNGKFREI